MPTIGIVAGEASGDLLGSHLIRALRKQRPDLKFVGIAGPKMIAEGAETLFPMERLSVRGYVEVLRHLPGLLKIRKEVAQHFLDHRPDVFIGIDAPDFNFTLERKLKRQGIPTVHYVSPSIWAWRRGKIKKIQQAVSHMLALFPFEPEIYRQAGVPVSYVGHPLADMLPLEPDLEGAREELKLPQDSLVIAMLPGSRQSEVQQLADLYIKTAKLIFAERPDVRFLVPLITRETRAIFERALYANEGYDLPVNIMFGHAHQAMEAANAVIVASGTATLEAALIKRPMIITYRMPNLSWQILKRMKYLPYVGLPNVLAGRFIVPELLQHDAVPEKLAATLLQMLNDKSRIADIQAEFRRMHELLRQNTEEKAAQAVLSFIK
ncbi:lipid-A-disaccharide synthase [Methylobacillus flagellatus]|uniref:lipid-A-disaccharide synthase n=1 Tax=Methylobacillus flagellatus TaxID=405 RepID=UPI002853EC9B|nr:lipid-A-disaccharide synthase [Methylobacillus flagellatus]MDR5171472.1 lipid-A-disaccharide synthase [Methylobacillus flagellatus]